jgi:hypothetical protein
MANVKKRTKFGPQAGPKARPKIGSKARPKTKPKPAPKDLVKGMQEDVRKAQVPFPRTAQDKFIIHMLTVWENRQKGESIVVDSWECGSRTMLFGVLSRDWPGLSNACLGVLHEIGWNVDFVKGFSIRRKKDSLGIVIIGVMTPSKDQYSRLEIQSHTITEKLHKAAEGSKAKAHLMAEEMRKLEIYSQVIAEIEKQDQGENLEALIGLNGEVFKFFAARSHDYIENRSTADIARQIIRNYAFIKNARETGSSIHLDISNFETKREGVFTGVTVAGPASMLNLEDCLKTIGVTVPDFQLKHNREFTTDSGISLYRIEFVDMLGNPLGDMDQAKMRKAFSTLVLNKNRNRAQWIESIGGFEQYARAIIPLLVREAQNTNKTQVYQSVGQTTNVSIDFKVIVVVPRPGDLKKKLVNKTVNAIESVPGLTILAVKPAVTYENAQVFIIDLRADLLVMENVETIYRSIKEKIHAALGEFRDFDEGMRTLDTEKLKMIRRRIEGVDKSLIRELYYSIEDFFRIGASMDELIAHVRIALDMLKIVETSNRHVHVLARQTGPISKDGAMMPKASLLCVAYPHDLLLLQPVLELLETFEVTLSRLEKSGWNILICRIEQEDKALPEAELRQLAKRAENLNETEPPQN